MSSSSKRVNGQITFRNKQLRELREQLRTVRQSLGTQQEVGEQIGLGQSRISKIEQGNIPSSEYLQRLASLANLPYEQAIYWLGMAGHLPWTRMPTAQQIEKTLSIYCDDIARDDFPSYIIDYRLMVWAHNRASYNATSYEKGIQIMQNETTLFDILFNSDLAISSDSSFMQSLFTEETIYKMQMIPIIFFKLLNLHRRHEPFYELYPTFIENRLTNSNDIKHFRQMWNDIAVSTDTSYESLNNLVRDYMNFGAWLTPFKHQIEQDNFFEFNNRFEIIAHMPQFAVVRLEPRQGGQEFSAMLASLLGANQDQVPYQAVWQPEINSPEVVKRIVEQYNADNLCD